MFVDTAGPNINLSADADGEGTVDAAIEITDATSLKEIRLRYATDVDTRWSDIVLGDPHNKNADNKNIKA